MKRAILGVIAFCLTMSAHAEPGKVTVQYQEGRLAEFVRLVYGELTPKSYVLAPELLTDQQLITVKLREVTPARVEQEAARMAKALGYAVTESGGVVRFARAVEVEEERETIVYSPLHRSGSYLREVLAGVFREKRKSSEMAPLQAPVSAVIGAVMPGNLPISGEQIKTEKYDAFAPGAKADIVVFTGTEKERQKFKRLMSELDIRAQELLVKAVVYEVRKSRGEGSALNLALGLLKGKIGLTITGGADVGNAIKVEVGGFDAVFSALSGDHRFKLVSAPTVRIRSGSSAKFTAGQEVPILGNVTMTQQGSQQSVTYKNAGVILDLHAEARGQGVDLTIGQQISNFVPTTNGVNTTPTLVKREITTQVTAADEDLIVLGGLDETQETGNETGLSFLPAFMRASDSNAQSTEIVVFLNVQRI